MKNLSLSSIFIASFFLASAQQPGKSVINCMGGVLQATNGMQLKFSVGEATTSTLESNGVALYQGFFSGGRSLVFSGVEKIANATHLQVFPNPVAHILFFRSSDAGINQVTITNTVGQQVLSQEGDSPMNVADLQAGFYQVRMKDENNQVSITKIIKQ